PSAPQATNGLARRERGGPGGGRGLIAMDGPFPPPGRYGEETLALQSEDGSADLHSRLWLGRTAIGRADLMRTARRSSASPGAPPRAKDNSTGLEVCTLVTTPDRNHGRAPRQINIAPCAAFEIGIHGILAISADHFKVWNRRRNEHSGIRDVTPFAFSAE